jgi:S1-C subfamily serine protease
VSNFHVVENATDIRIVLADRREFAGRLVLADEEADIAVIRLAGGEDLPALTFADSDAVEVGDLVLAVGNPFGVGQTVSSGIVSGLARSGRGGGAFTAGGYFIQTDAPINPGNSGGALVDMQGRLVGINTQIVTRSGGSNGIGFAIPANLVARVVAQAAEGAASFTRPWAGVEVQTVDADIAEALGLDRPQGLLVRALAPASPFAEAGVQPGDVILDIGGQTTDAPGELSFRLSLQELGSIVPVALLSNGERRIVGVEMRAASTASEAIGAEPVTIARPGPFQGLVVQELSPLLAEQLGLRQGLEGVIVLGMENPGRARNFQPGDVISQINGQTIRSMTDFLSAADDDRRTWQMVIERRGGRVYLTWRG